MCGSAADSHAWPGRLILNDKEKWLSVVVKFHLVYNKHADLQTDRQTDRQTYIETKTDKLTTTISFY